MIETIFNAQKIAIIGATERENSVGSGIVKNLQNSGKQLFFVNSRVSEIFNQKSYSKVTEIEEKLDLAIIAIPRDFVLGVVKDCVKKRVGGVIIISAGFSELGEEGEILENQIKQILLEAQIPFVGPNSLGIIRPSFNLNASFSPGTPQKGGLALISQSGALIDSIIDGAKEENYGFSVIVSVGNAAGISIPEYIEFADKDKETEVILLYIEGVNDGRKFFNTLKNTKKPVVILKGGKTEKSKKAISSHTGSLAGEYRIFSSAISQAGAIEVDSLEELFDSGKVLSWQKNGDKNIGVVTNGGGAGILFTDSAYKEGLTLPDISEEAIKKIENSMHPGYSKGNPLDIVGDALTERYETACRALLDQENISVLVIIQTIQIMTNPIENAKMIVNLSNEYSKPIVTIFMGAGEKTKQAVKILEENKIPNYLDPKRAAKAIKHLSKNKKI